MQMHINEQTPQAYSNTFKTPRDVKTPPNNPPGGGEWNLDNEEGERTVYWENTYVHQQADILSTFLHYENP